MKQIRSIEDVIEALGGIGAVASLTGRAYGVVWNWKYRGAFPANTYMVLKSALKAKGTDAPGALWNMAEAS